MHVVLMTQGACSDRHHLLSVVERSIGHALEVSEDEEQSASRLERGVHATEDKPTLEDDAPDEE